jgi:anti-sigma factor RsiW
MKCRNVQKQLSAYQDNELETHEREQVKEHLLNCRTCREQHAEFSRVWETLGELPEIRPNSWFYQQLIRKIKEPHERGLFPTLQNVFRLFRAPVTVSIILIIGLLVGSYLGNILVRCDFFPFQPERTTYSQEALFDSLKVFDPAPPGTLAHGYLQMVNYKENEPR